MAVGVFGIGVVINAYAILIREMDRNYQGTAPASAILWTVAADRRSRTGRAGRPDIADAEARRRIVGRVLVGPDEWRDLWLFVINDFEDDPNRHLTPERGKWPPADGEILLERAALWVAKAQDRQLPDRQDTRRSWQAITPGRHDSRPGSCPRPGWKALPTASSPATRWRRSADRPTLTNSGSSWTGKALDKNHIRM